MSTTKTMRIRFSREWLAMFERVHGHSVQPSVRQAMRLATVSFKLRRMGAGKPVEENEIPTEGQVRYYLKKKQEASR